MEIHKDFKKMLLSKSLFIFDLDGTLFNTLGDLAPSVNYALNQIGFTQISHEKICECIGNGSFNLIKRSLALALFNQNNKCFKKKILNVRDSNAVLDILNKSHYTLERITEIHNIFSTYYWKHCTENTKIYEGVLEFLQWIHNSSLKGQKKIAAIVTNKPSEPTYTILEKFNIKDLFEIVLCGDTSPEKKPSPKGIEYILSKTNTQKNKSIMIGDDTPDIMAAKNASIDCAICLKGYGNPQKLIPLKPEYCIEHIYDFKKFY